MWSGDEGKVSTLLNALDADANALDADGLSPWDWAEAKGNESMMNILAQHHGRNLPTWTLQVKPNQQDREPVLRTIKEAMLWSNRVREAIGEQHVSVLLEEQV